MLDQHTVSHRQVFLRCNALAVTLPSGTIKVGRGPDCFICLDDPGVSRLHFRITVGDSVTIEDLGSKNGTRVNGEPIQGRQSLVEGDEISVGQRVFIVGFGFPVEPEDQATPPEARRGATLPGVGAAQVDLGERCPRCRGEVSFGAAACATCGFEWPRGSRRAPTRQEQSACRRCERRIPVRIPARFASARWEGQGEILNLSLRGAFFTSPTTETVGTRCQLEVRGDEERLLALGGVVRHAIHRGGKGMGIEFTGLDEPAREWLRRRLALYT